MLLRLYSSASAAVKKCVDRVYAGVVVLTELGDPFQRLDVLKLILLAPLHQRHLNRPPSSNHFSTDLTFWTTGFLSVGSVSCKLLFFGMAKWNKWKSAR